MARDTSSIVPGEESVFEDLDGTPAKNQYIDLDDEKKGKGDGNDGFDFDFEMDNGADDEEEGASGGKKQSALSDDDFEDDDEGDGNTEKSDEEEEGSSDEESGGENEEDRHADFYEKIKNPNVKKEFKKRLDREYRLRTKAEEEARAQTDRLSKLEESVAKTNLQNLQLRKAAGVMRHENLTTKLESIKAQLRTAIEDGDTDKNIELAGQQAKIVTDIEAAAAFVETVEAELADYEKGGKGGEKKGGDESGGDGGGDHGKHNVALNVWLGRNNTWWQKNEKRTALALEINSDLLEEKRNPRHSDFYRELDKRLNARLEESRRNRGLPPTGGKGESRGNPGARGSSNNPNRVVITPSDIRMMRELGLDTSNKKILKEYAANKRELAMKDRNNSKY